MPRVTVAEKYMRLAMQLACRAKGRTSPNPLVGAVVVRGGRILGQGYHARAGGLHAEVVALDEAGTKARGATLYVTMEPCTHFGRTPPCVYKVIRSGIREVCAGMIDPNPLNNGKGLALLKANGIKVRAGILEEELRAINQPFIKFMTRRMPYVTVKTAESLDGKIATETGDSKWITGDKARSLAHRMRQEYDAIMVGINTVLRDNPRLDAWFSKKQPVKVIVDSNLSTPVNANIFASGAKVILVTLPKEKGQETANRQLLAGKATILEVKERDGQVSLRDMMKKLAAMGISSVLVEGGGTLNGSLFDEGLVDRVLFFISPKIVGGKHALGSVMGRGVSRIDRALKLTGVSLRRVGEDILVEGYVQRYS
jgi:diaminohydroxyphosphoribosylaminopyrimidine deaminase / 5-amino-6-(5-phosphoribosylamino)uracil reductase